MSTKWKLHRNCDGEEFHLKPGENNLGRSMSNEVTITELCVSRKHSVIFVDGDVVTIKDCNSSNGTYVGSMKIMPLTLQAIKEGDIIGIGCIAGITNTVDYERVAFVLKKVNENEGNSRSSIESRLRFVDEVIELDSDDELPPNVPADELPPSAPADEIPSNLTLNQKNLSHEPHIEVSQNVKEILPDHNVNNDIIEIASDSENERASTPIEEIKAENFEDELPFIKEEYNIGDDDFIECISDNEDDVWAVRLSQNSPGKPQRRTMDSNFKEQPEIKLEGIVKLENNANIVSNIYIDEDEDDKDDENYSEDLIMIPDIEEQMEALHKSQIIEDEPLPDEASLESHDRTITADNVDAISHITVVPVSTESFQTRVPESDNLLADNFEIEKYREPHKEPNNIQIDTEKVPAKKTGLKRMLLFEEEPVKKRKKTSKSKVKGTGQTLTAAEKDALREERRRQLKELANRQNAEKEKVELEEAHTKRIAASVSAKITNASRGDFLTNMTEIKYTQPEKEKRKLSKETSSERRDRSFGSTSSTQSDKSELDVPQKNTHRSGSNDSIHDSKKSDKKESEKTKSKKRHRSSSTHSSGSKVKRKTSTEKMKRDRRHSLDSNGRKRKDSHRRKSTDSNNKSSERKIGEFTDRNGDIGRSEKDKKKTNTVHQFTYKNKEKVKNYSEIIKENTSENKVNKLGNKIIIGSKSKSGEKSDISHKDNIVHNSSTKIKDDEIENKYKSDKMEKTEREKTVISGNHSTVSKENTTVSAVKGNIVHNSSTKLEDEEIENKYISDKMAKIEREKMVVSGNSSTVSKENIAVRAIKQSQNMNHKNNNKSEKETIPNATKVLVSILKKPMPENGAHVKPKKKISFSTKPVEVIHFEIEPGHNMKKTSECKATMIQSRIVQLPLEKQFLAFVLRWSTKWLEEQINIKEPPNVLPHSLPPMAMCHAFEDYSIYQRILSDLLLMELWESVTQGYMKKRTQPYPLKMQLEVPPLVSDDKIIPTTLSVNLSLHKNEKVPRMGEVMLVMVESEQKQWQLFKHLFYIHNVRNLPAPRNNVNQFFSISLVTVNTQSLRHLQRGAVMLGKTLCFIKNELVLMEAIEQLKWSPLAPVILRPEPAHFRKFDCSKIKAGKYEETYNPSQLLAVKSTVAAALSDRPSIQMIQGPPGTGKSSVITTIIMSYFYSEGRRQSGRGKILVCATSNAAVDGLVKRLLDIRQNLPSSERFRMVRVGRIESMHPVAANVSLNRLAEINATASRNNGLKPGFSSEEFNWLEAKLNSIRNRLEAESKDSAAVPALEKRRDDCIKRIELMRSMCNMNGEPTREELADAERRVIENSDIVVTTLASVANNRLKCLVDRIAMCIVDEAGQSIEPETLIPLTLRVTKMALIGDPRQLPGFINSQHAKKYGLGESLFSRLSATTEDWVENPVVLLNVQYRMHPAIANYPNRAFYEGRVRDAAQAKELPLPPYSMVCVGSSSQQQGESSGVNEMEAWGVSRLVAELTALTRSLSLELAVITPYIAQRDLIKRCLFTLMDKESQQVEVNTVDSFQGLERDVVVVSLGRSHGVGFLTDPGRVNVMLTRAKHALIVCLNTHALQVNNQWRSLVEDAKKRSCFINLPNYACHHTTAEIAKRNPVLPLLFKK